MNRLPPRKLLERADIVGSWPPGLLYDVADACGAHHWLGSDLSLRYDDILDAPLCEIHADLSRRGLCVLFRCALSRVDL